MRAIASGYDVHVFYGDAQSYAQGLQVMSSTKAFIQSFCSAGYLDEHGTPCDFASRPNGTSAPVLGLSQVQRAMAQIEAVEKQKATFPPRSAAPKRPRARSPSPELDISDEDEPEGESALAKGWMCWCASSLQLSQSTGTNIAACNYNTSKDSNDRSLQ